MSQLFLSIVKLWDFTCCQICYRKAWCTPASKSSDNKVLTTEAVKLLELPKHIVDGEAAILVIGVGLVIVSVFVSVAAAQPLLPFAVKVNITLPAAISAALGV